MPNLERIKNIPVDKKYFLFRSCAISNKLPGIESSTVEVLSRLGITTETSDDQTCCGGGAIIFTSIGEVATSLLASARGITIAAEKKLNTLTMCNGCYKNLVEFNSYINSNQKALDMVNEKFSQINRKYNGQSHIVHIQELMYILKEEVKEKILHPLSDFRFATHYGCHYLYGTKDHAIDDPFQPVIMEEIIETLGARTLSYAEQRSCCGSGKSNNLYHDQQAVAKTVIKKLGSFNSIEADAVVVSCPFCLMTLDRMQHYMTKGGAGEFTTPVIYLTQLIGLAMGIHPDKLGFATHITSVKRLLEKMEACYA